jgi:hypothetical protein
VLDALRRVEAERDSVRATRAQPAPQLTSQELARPRSGLRPWRLRRRRREAARAARRTEAAARQAAGLARLDDLERRLRALDETLTKQLGELEPRLLHAFELRWQGLERELASLVHPPAPAAEPPARALRPGWLAACLGLAFALGVGFARACAS